MKDNMLSGMWYSEVARKMNFIEFGLNKGIKDDKKLF